MSSAHTTLGIIAGSGALPITLASVCAEINRPVFVVALEGAAEAVHFAAHPHAVVRLGAVGEAMERLRAANASEIVMAGGVKRPSISSLAPDAAGAKLMARLGLKLFGGDDALLKGLIAFLEDEGFTVVGAESVAATLLGREGALTALTPDDTLLEDIHLGLKAAQGLGKKDVGQAVVVAGGRVIAEEDASGTDALIVRSAALIPQGARAVLVKAKKPQQETRADLPAIGPETVAAAVRAGFSGIAFQAGGTIVLDASNVARAADAAGLFVVGVSWP